VILNITFFSKQSERKFMAGRNQHHIPQFFQRGFGVRCSGKPREIWKYERGAEPKLSEIKHTAAEDFFYSPVSNDGTKTLDDRITDLEDGIARKVDGLRRTQIGSGVDAALAIEVLTHLAPRTSHLRSFFARGMAGLSEGAREIFTNRDNLKVLLGLDADEPSAIFQKKIADHIGEGSPFAQLGLPRSVMEKVAFRLAKENFDRSVEEEMPQVNAVLEAMALTAPQMARDGHNEALIKMGADSKRDDLIEYSWAIEAAPLGGAILPDCIAIAFAEEGWHAFIGSARDEATSIVLALSTNKLLVGSKNGEPLPSLGTINVHAAACCHDFFLAATDAHVALVDEIGKVPSTDLEEGLNGAIQEFLPQRVLAVETANIDAEPTPEDQSVKEGPPSGNFSYQVRCLDFGDQELVERIAEILKYVVANIASIIPLDRLDGITFSADYPAGLRSIDRGRPDLPAPKTVSEDIGIGVAMTLPVERGNLIKGHIVLAASIGLGLVDEAESSSKSALHTVVHELAQVSMIQLFDQALPGVIFNPILPVHEGRLFLSISNALDGYAASRISSCFGDGDNIMRVHQELLISTLAFAQQKIPEARLAYRYHADILLLIDLARPIVEHILSFSAKLLGCADGLHRTPCDDEGSVKVALEKAGLLAWFKTFEVDLRVYWDRRGQWESLDELFVFNRHVERVYWQFGMFWSHDDSDGSRLDIPLAIDASALLEATARSA
jgi:hypothetical protein